MGKPNAGHFKKGHKVGNRFKPGESGNPNGRPRKFQAVADAALAKIADGMDGREALFTVLFEKALAGDIRCIEIILQRDWPVSSAVEISGGLSVEQRQEAIGKLEKLIDLKRTG